MKLSDVVGGSGLAVYAEVALLIFMIAFAAVALRLLFTKRERLDRMARLPLDDDAPGSRGD